MIYHNPLRGLFEHLATMTDEEFLIQLGKRIAEIRKDRGLSQLDLGGLINMEKPNISAIENGRQNASSLTLKRIADALKCEVSDFFNNH